ncbi:MAG TPA: ribosome small subunit-dependent GTPase A [Thermomicrobiales bacterium]|nr:ribosome small subunit-dependent GTPase A [Thermomicrobiales bacterium]
MPIKHRSRPAPGRRPAEDAAPSDSGPAEGSVRGLVTRAHGLWFEVALDGQNRSIIATLRGQLKRRRQKTDIVAVGDRVWVGELPDGEGAIEYVEPRIRVLARTARHTRDTEQIVLANPDQVLFVFAVREPTPHVRMLDRFLILAELQDIPIRIAISKMDLVETTSDSCADRVFASYEGIYPVHRISAVTGEGLPELRATLEGRITAVAGPSGVGKSSLLNALDPDTARDVGAISLATGKGRHTTIGTRLHDLGNGTYVADTPGIRALAMSAIPSDRLDWLYREFRPFLGGCFYPDCTHVHEPGCDVREAVERGNIPLDRYESYRALRTGDELAEEVG